MFSVFMDLNDKSINHQPPTIAAITKVLLPTAYRCFVLDEHSLLTF